MKKIFSILIFIIFIVSCENQMLIRFNNNIYKRWFSSREISFVQKNYINSEEALLRPPNTVQHILSVVTEKNQKDCFYYKIPGSIKSGEVLIKEVSAFKECPNFPERPFRWHIKDIEILKISVDEKENTLNIKFKSGVFEDAIKIAFFNVKLKIENEEKPDEYKKYSSSASTRKELGLSVWKSNKNILRIRKENPYEIIPEMFYQAKKCHDFNDQCNEVLKNTCSQCAFGFFEVIGKNCPKGKIKYCGPNKCGQRGWPACPRGYEYTKEIDPYKCEDGKAGFCNKGLKPTCSGDNILICL